MAKKAKITGFIGVRVPMAAAVTRAGKLKSGCRWEYFGDPRSGVKKRPVCDVPIKATDVTCEKDRDGNVIRCWANKQFPGGTSKGHGFRTKPAKAKRQTKPAKKSKKSSKKKR